MIRLNVRSRLFGLALSTLVALASVSVASAGAPVVEGPIHEEGSSVLADCGSFQVLDVYELNIVQRLFFDKQGNLLRIVEQLWGTDTFTNSVTGKAYPMSFHNNVVVDFTTSPPQGASSGVGYRLVVPGAGAVFLDVGRIVIDRQGTVYFEAGPHQATDGDFAGLCAALA
jgi:hypothetical protein